MLHAIALYATAILLGAMLFFSFATTPVVFKTLEGENASVLLRALFPLYYLIIIVLGALAALTLAIAEQPMAAAGMALVAGMAVLTRQFLIPRLDALRPGRAAGEALATRQFRQLHGLSMVINLLQMLVAGGVLSVFVP